ncbi:MAG: TdeIII family type II restriction endonuclease, partial [Planctomycetaceae bacterium]|nr:TdeIII family type II restriction endonuclease [Planctomycetaceae bacterium]
MTFSEEQKTEMQHVIINCLRKKIQDYKWTDNNMPFHFRLLGKDRMALYSFVQSLLTTFGTSIFEPVAVAIAKKKFEKAECQYVVGKTIYENCQQSIQKIINALTTESSNPDKVKEINILKNSLTGQLNKLKSMKIDLFVENKQGEQFLFDLKTAKPNKGDFQKYKQTLLEWAGIALTQNANVKVHTMLAIPYNPFAPAPYQTWTMKGMIDKEHELKVAEDFWNFLGGEGTYEELLYCFEEAGQELRGHVQAKTARRSANFCCVVCLFRLHLLLRQILFFMILYFP